MIIDQINVQYNRHKSKSIDVKLLMATALSQQFINDTSQFNVVNVTQIF